MAKFAELPPKQRQLARFFLDHEEVVAFVSAHEVGERTGISPATVVRFCQVLGYEGYPDLQAAIRAQFPPYRTAVQKLADHMADGISDDHLATQVAQTSIRNIEQTLSRVSEAQLTEAVTDIIQARQIRVFGSGISAAAAVFAQHALVSLGFSVRLSLNGGVEQIMELARLTDQDVVIGISVWRYLRHTIEAIETAREIGASCIALTDSPVAPVAALADYVFVADIEGAVHSRSLIGMLSLIDLISDTIALRRPQESMTALQRIDQLYRQNDMLQSE